MHVIAACLYIACRREKAPTLLIDFADALKVRGRRHCPCRPWEMALPSPLILPLPAAPPRLPPQVNVYTLGACFLKFIRFLNLELPVVDPSLYVHRFASKVSCGACREPCHGGVNGISRPCGCVYVARSWSLGKRNTAFASLPCVSSAEWGRIGFKQGGGEARCHATATVTLLPAVLMGVLLPFPSSLSLYVL